MIDVDVLFLVEHVARELDVACAVKYLAGRERGITVQVASLLTRCGYGKTLRTHRPRVVVLPYFYTQEAHLQLLEALPAWPSEVVLLNLNYEQIFSPHDRRVRAPQDDLARGHVLHHAWGQPFADYLVEHGVPPAHIHVNGHPGLSLYLPRYREYFATRAQLARRFGLDVSKRWVFVAEQYKTAHWSEADMESLVQRGFDPRQVRDRHAFDRSSLGEATRWWAAAARTGRVELIVRPRPSTPLAPFRERMVQDLGGAAPPGLHLLKEGSVREWVLASDLVASSYSTTLIEAAVARTPAAMLLPRPFPDYLFNAWHPAVAKVEAAEAFVALARGEGQADFAPLRAWARADILVREDAIAGLVELLERLVREGPPAGYAAPRAGEDYPAPTQPLPEAPVGPRGPAELARHALGQAWVQGWRRLGVELDPEPDEHGERPPDAPFHPPAWMVPVANWARERSLARTAEARQAEQAGLPIDLKHEQDDFAAPEVLERTARWAETLELESGPNPS